MDQTRTDNGNEETKICILVNPPLLCGVLCLRYILWQEGEIWLDIQMPDGHPIALHWRNLCCREIKPKERNTLSENTPLENTKWPNMWCKEIMHKLAITWTWCELDKYVHTEHLLTGMWPYVFNFQNPLKYLQLLLFYVEIVPSLTIWMFPSEVEMKFE